MNIKELKSKWNKEKEAYRTQEVGSGVQIFVKDILQSENVFALKKGLKSTPPEKRKNEFLEEEKTKEQRTADIVIYISPEIIIPVEIEKYQNIEAGTKQLLKYQADLDKKYGILTDGFTWRFYTNNIFREFTLDKIFDETEEFLEFWKEYIKPEFYYLLFFEPFGQLPFIKQETLPVEQNRQMFFEDITRLIRSFKNKLKIEGYLNGLLDKKTKEKMAVELTYAYIIQFILYKTLVDNEFGTFKKDFEKIVEVIHKNLKEKRYKEILGIIDGISAQISENIYRPFKKEQEFIREKLLKVYHGVENKLSDVSPWLDIFVFIKKYNFANIENEIFGYIYENYLKEIYEEKKKGQYFTDPAVVNFMLQQIGFTPEEIKKRYEKDKNSISLIDPACGSGTFLYSAVDRIIKAFDNHTEEKSKQIEEIVNNNIFGLDIDEFTIYLAEMNILMRMLPLIITEKYNNPVDKKIKVFLTKDSIAEFRDTVLANTIHDFELRGRQHSLFKELDLGYTSYVREESDLEEMKNSLEERPQIPRRRFDYVISNPPYIGYNECSKQKVLIFELMKQGKANLNNIYGVNLHSIPNNQKKYAPKPNLYAFFVALGITLLKDNGKLCYIIPQTILTAGDLDVIRYHLAKFTTIEKIITFSGKMFIGRGLKQDKPVATSSLIFVVNRKMPSPLHQVEIINYTDPNDTIEEALQNILSSKTNRKITKKKILQNKLFQNVANWNFIKQSKKFLDFYEEYQRNTQDISIYYEHILAEQKFKSRFYFDIGYNINEKLLQDKIISDGYQYPKLSDEFWSIKSIKGYWQNERNEGSKFQIKLLTTNQGYNLLDTPYKVLWSYINPKKFHFSSLPLIWARNQICAIGSKNKTELFYLFAILNSPINQNLLNTLLKTEQEKDLLVSLASVKEFVRIPKITEDNQKIKEEIIRKVEEMLNLEDMKLSDFVDFSKVMLQKFDKISVEGNDLILERDNKKIKVAIKEKKDLVKKVLNEKYGKQVIDLEKQKISLSELKDLPIIDYEKQRKIKNYIDDLVFALYFNIKLENLGLNKTEKIKEKCSKNPYYRLMNQ
jgi:hypothetical protein